MNQKDIDLYNEIHATRYAIIEDFPDNPIRPYTMIVDNDGTKYIRNPLWENAPYIFCMRNLDGSFPEQFKLEEKLPQSGLCKKL
jgi:hypothetical protein